MSIGDLFTDAQKSTHGHKSLAKRLRKLEYKSLQKGRSEDFQDEVKDCVLRLFEIAKSEPAGNRTVKFLAAYFATPLKSTTGNTKPATKSKKQQYREIDDDGDEDEEMEDRVGDSMIEEQNEDEDEEEENATATAVLQSLAPFLSARDKTVRYRTLQIVSTILSSLNSVDDDLYRYLRHEAMKRLKDRVPAIRLEAVLMLGPMVETELDLAEHTRIERDHNSEDSYGDGDGDYDEDSAQASSLLEKLLDVLANDTNADVRRALLLNLPISADTLPYLLERARDKDAATRRAFYQKLCLQRLGDFRHLSVSMREKLLRWGLRDRDERVRKLAARMFREKWIEDCARTRQPQVEVIEEGGQNSNKQTEAILAPCMPALYELLERIDVVNTGGEGGAAHEAMKEFWTGRPDYVEEPTFDDVFWSELSTESAFVMRSWNDYCQSKPEFYELVENRMPEVTRFGFHLQGKINDLTAMIERNNQRHLEDEAAIEEQEEEETTDQEFIVEQLLHVAQTLDYTDEIGRRKMFGLFRNAITLPDFPEECTKLAVEALRLTCTPDAAGEREFTSVILEAISEVHDIINITGEGDQSHNNTEDDRRAEREDSFVSARSEVSHTSNSSTMTTKPTTSNNQPPSTEAHHLLTLTIQLKCLMIAHTTLQNVSGRISANIHLSSLLESLILPCVRSHDAPLREKGLECLALCCLLEPSMAIENKAVFLRCLKLGDEDLKILCLRALCDFTITHSTSPSSTPTDDDPDKFTLDLTPFVRVFTDPSPETTPEVQLTATTSLGKMMLCGLYEGNEEEFDDAVVAAETNGVKGWEVLKKVRIAVQKDGGNEDGGVGDAGVDREAVVKTPRRKMAGTVVAS